MAEHRHKGPQGHVIKHNHSNGDYRHGHGMQKGWPADRWTYVPPTPKHKTGAQSRSKRVSRKR